MANESRTGHPYYMYEAVQAQPATFAEVVGRIRPQAAQLAAQLTACQRLFIAGIGTSFHAAQVGQFLMRHYGQAAQAIHSFDFTLYGPDLSPADGVIVLSHRGGKRYSLEALKRANEAGCFTLLITGEGQPESARYATATLNTTPQEKSSAHTLSFTGTVAALACLTEGMANRQYNKASLYPASFLQTDFPATLQKCLQTEDQIAQFVAGQPQPRRIWLAGGGPSAITAHEIALKIKETSYLQAEGMPTETLLHGPFQCVEASDLFILIAPSGPAQSRTLEMAAMIKEIGASCLLVSDGSASLPAGSVTALCEVPPVPEPFTALTCLLPLQLFTYHLALKQGTNPDGFRLEDPRFARAGKLIQL